MEILDARSTLLTNVEILELLNDIKKLRALKAEIKLEPSTSLIVDEGPKEPRAQNHNTIVYECFKYLNESPAAFQRKEALPTVINALAKFKLTGAEVMQIVNLRPKQAIEVQLIVEECEERLTEDEVDELVRIVAEYLPDIPKK